MLRSKISPKHSLCAMQFTPTTGKRNRNTLAVNNRDGKFLAISQTKSTYLTSRGRVWTTEEAVRAHYQAKTAVSASRHVEEIIDMKVLFSDLGRIGNPVCRDLR